MTIRRFAATTAMLALGAAMGRAQSVRAVRVDASPKIDGVTTDACWRAAPGAPWADRGAMADLSLEGSWVRAGFDEKGLYLAVHVLGKRQPGESIYARVGEVELKAEESGIDSDAGGWSAEIAIPWTSFPSLPADPSISITRRTAAGEVLASWGSTNANGPQGTLLGIPRDPRLTLTGYAYGGVDEGEAQGKVGADARYRFTNDLAGWLSINPDFRNIPLGIASIDFSYFERLPEERRPFFQEGSSFFRSPLIEVSPFASVRLSSFDLGAKLYGRLGPATEVGLLGIEDFRIRNDAVVTVRQSLTPTESAAFQYAGRHQDRLNNDVVAGSVTSQRGDWGFQAGFGFSQTNTLADQTMSGAIDWRSNGWNAGAAYIDVGEQFFALDGFVPFIDEKGYQVNVGRSTPVTSGPVRNFAWSFGGESFEHQDGRFYRNNATLGIDAQLSNRYSVFGSVLVGRFEENDDRVVTVGLRSPNRSGRGGFGFSAASGQLGGFDYSRFSPYFNYGVGRLSLTALTELVHLDDLASQNIVWLAYDAGRGRSLSGRLIERQGDVGGYVEYRQPGIGGSTYSLIVGDPNRFEFRGRFIVKVVWPF